jgi:signal transduction histidine kinase
VDGYPLAVLMGVGENEAMADYYEHRNAYFLVAAIVSLLFARQVCDVSNGAAPEKEQDSSRVGQPHEVGILAHMSHELRTPLNGILGCSDFCRPR